MSRALLLTVALVHLASTTVPCTVAAALAADPPSAAGDTTPILKVLCPCGCGPGPATWTVGGSWLGPPARAPEAGPAPLPGSVHEGSPSALSRVVPSLDHVPLPA